MGVGEISIAAATAVVGYDLCSTARWQQMGVPRALTGIGLAGSAAALDTEIALSIDDVYIGSFLNTATGAVLLDAHLRPLDGNYVPRTFWLYVQSDDTNPDHGHFCSLGNGYSS